MHIYLTTSTCLASLTAFSHISVYLSFSRHILLGWTQQNFDFLTPGIMPPKVREYEYWIILCVLKSVFTQSWYLGEKKTDRGRNTGRERHRLSAWPCSCTCSVSCSEAPGGYEPWMSTPWQQEFGLICFCYTELLGTCKCSLYICEEYEGISLVSSVKTLGPHAGKPTPALFWLEPTHGINCFEGE